MENEISFDQKKLAIVGIDEVRPNSWNPKDKDTEEYKKIVKSVSTNGQVVPIYVRENGGYEIVDGEQRWTACRELGFGKVLVYNYGKMTDKKAMEMTIWLQQQVPFNEIELAGVVKKMAEQWSGLELPFTDEQIENYVKMSDFDWDQYNQEHETKEKEPVKVTCPSCGHEFEV